MNSVNERRCCERVNGFIKDNGMEGAKVAAAAGVVKLVCGPVIAGLGATGYSGYKIYKSLKAGPKDILIPNTSEYDRCFQSQLFRRLPPAVSEDIKKRAEGQPDLPRGKIRALREGNVNHPLFQEPNWTDVAMKAYLENEIDASTLHRLMIYAACQNESGGHVDSIKVFDPGGVEMLKQALNHGKSSRDDDEKGETRPIDCFLTENQWNRLLKKLRLTPNKAQFFLIPNPDREKQFALWSMFINIEESIGKERLFVVETKEGPKRAILPPDLSIEILKAKYGDKNVPEALNVFGERNIEKLSGKSRPVRIPCFPYLPCPKRIHEDVSATDLAYYLHDIFYHLLIESSMGNDHRNLWINLAKWVQPKSQEIFEFLLDKDMRIYSDQSVEHQATKSDRFWQALLLASIKYPQLINWICLYISQNSNQYEGINFDGFRAYDYRFGNSKLKSDKIKEVFEIFEIYPGIAAQDYARFPRIPYKASVS